MKSFLIDYKNRVYEINEYFSFVGFIDKIETHKNEFLTSSSKLQFTPKRELQKILRSNCFLLLYNLIESSIRNSILEVYDHVHDDSLKLEHLSDKLREIWIIHQSKTVQVTEKTPQKWLKGLIKDLEMGYEIRLEKDSINISGNLDYENIEKIINTYGFFGKISIDKNTISNNLGKIKRERNLLAHGNKTFCQSGEIITFPELIIIKDNLISFLTDILSNIEIYIDNKKYKQ